MAWNSEQYLKFAEERKQPCIDLLSRLDGNFDRILDLGCGPGNSTENLLIRYPHSTVIGFDSDDNMLDKARKNLPNIPFVKGDAPCDLDKLSGKFDLVFSNACIHWIPEQEKLICKVYDLLNDRGVFAAQIPLTEKSRFYVTLNQLIDQKWIKLKSVDNFHNMNDGYYNALSEHFKNVTVWQTDYYHVVEKNIVIEWYKGSGLRPYLDRLDEIEQKKFLDDLAQEIDNNYPLLADGKVFLVMPRLFFIAQK